MSKQQLQHNPITISAASPLSDRLGAVHPVTTSSQLVARSCDPPICCRPCHRMDAIFATSWDLPAVVVQGLTSGSPTIRPELVVSRFAEGYVAGGGAGSGPSGQSETQNTAVDCVNGAGLSNKTSPGSTSFADFACDTRNAPTCTTPFSVLSLAWSPGDSWRLFGHPCRFFTGVPRVVCFSIASSRMLGGPARCVLR